MKFFTIKRLTVLFLVNHVLVGTRCFASKRRLLNAVGYTLGEGTRVVGPVFCTGKLIAGKDCWIGRNFTIHGNGTVSMGDNCDIAPDVTILTGGHRLGPPERRAGAGETYTVRIEDGCWIGARSTLVGSVTMGAGSVLAACGCAVKDLPPNTLWGGVPAREIRKLYETEYSAE